MLGGKRTSSRHVAVVLLMCLLWYVISSSNNVIGKMVLNEFPFPMTVTLIQLCSITLYSGPFFNLWRIRKYQDIPRAYYMRLIVPLAIGKLLASVTSHISLWKVPVSYAHTGQLSRANQIIINFTRHQLLITICNYSSSCSPSTTVQLRRPCRFSPSFWHASSLARSSPPWCTWACCPS